MKHRADNREAVLSSCSRRLDRVETTITGVLTRLGGVESAVKDLSLRVDQNTNAIVQNTEKIDRNAAAIAVNAEKIDRNAAAIAVNAEKIDRNAVAIAVNAEKIDVNTQLLDRLAIEVVDIRENMATRAQLDQLWESFDRKTDRIFGLFDGIAGNQKLFEVELVANRGRTDRLEARVEVLEQCVDFASPSRTKNT